MIFQQVKKKTKKKKTHVSKEWENLGVMTSSNTRTPKMTK